MRTQPVFRTQRQPRPAAATTLLALSMALMVAMPPAWGARAHRPAHGVAEAPMTINLVNAEVSSAVQAVAAATHRNFIVDPRVKGQVTLQFEKPVSPEHVYLALLTQLRLAGYAVVHSDGVYRVVPEADARLQTTPVGIGEATGAIPGRGDQVVTQVFQLRNQPAGNLLAVLRPLISPNNTINVDPGSNALVITDYADNLKRLSRVIAGLDIPSGSDVDIVALHNTVATELAPTLQKLLDMQAGDATGTPRPAGATPTVAGGGTGLRAVVVPDAANNALIVRAANGAQLLQIERMITRLDRPGAGAEAGDDIHVVYLKNASAASMARILRGVLTSPTASDTSNSAHASSPGSQSSASAMSANNGANSTTTGSSGAGDSGGLGQAPNFTPPQDGGTVSLPQGGTVYADVSMNALIINAPPPLYEQLRRVISKLDVRRAQVYVQALIAEVDANKAAALGIQWQAIAGSAGNTNAVFGGTNFTNNGVSGSNIINLQAGLSAGGSAAASALASGTLAIPQGLNIGLLHNVAGNAVLGALANFLQTQDGANILSAPTLMTLDNEDAKIVVGQNVPFITGQYAQTGGTGNTVNPFQTISRNDVGLTLKVRPQITAGDAIKMDVYQEVSSIASTSNASGIITNKRSIQTAVLVDDGQTIVLGGLMQDNVNDNTSKIPGLGDLPGVGALFRSKARQGSKTDLLVFLRPVIVRDQASGDALSRTNYDHMLGLQRGSALGHSPGMPDLPPPVLPSLETPGALATPAKP